MFWDEIQETLKETSINEHIEADDLDQVLSDPLVFENLHQGDEKVTSYLTRKDVLTKLLDMTLSSTPDENVDLVNQYKGANSAIGVLSLGNDEVTRALVENEEILRRITSFLKSSEAKHLNPITTGFYRKLILSLASSNTHGNLFLNSLFDSDFIDDILTHLQFGALADLLVRLPAARIYPDFQQVVFNWFADRKVPQKLIALLNPETSEEVVENIIYIFQEFDEMQLIAVETANVFVDNFYNVDNANLLMNQAFPDKESAISPHISIASSQILAMFTDINHDSEEPAYKVNSWLYMRAPSNEMYDPTFAIEAFIARRSPDVVRVMLYSCQHDDSLAFAPVAVACISLLQSLINTTNFSTHFELRHTLMEAETSWSKILTEISHRPMFTVFNCRVVSFFAYILFSKTNEGYPLMDMLFRSSPSFLDVVIDKTTALGDQEDLNISGRAELQFFAQLYLYISEAQSSQTSWGTHLHDLINETGLSECWNDLSNTLKSVCDTSTGRLQVDNSGNSTGEREVVVDELDNSGSDKKSNLDTTFELGEKIQTSSFLGEGEEPSFDVSAEDLVGFRENSPPKEEVEPTSEGEVDVEPEKVEDDGKCSSEENLEEQDKLVKVNLKQSSNPEVEGVQSSGDKTEIKPKAEEVDDDEFTHFTHSRTC